MPIEIVAKRTARGTLIVNTLYLVRSMYSKGMLCALTVLPFLRDVMMLSDLAGKPARSVFFLACLAFIPCLVILHHSLRLNSSDSVPISAIPC